jgi:flagellar secretion chaperone FliS
MSGFLSANQAASAYRAVAVTVPPLAAIVMLYDGAITFLQRSAQALEARRIEEAHNHLLRATAILRGLDHNLDFGREGDLAERLHRTYNAFILAALRSFGRPDARERYRRIIAGLAQMRDAWAGIAGIPPIR